MQVRQGLRVVLAVLAAPLYRRLKTRPVLLVGGHEGKLFADNGRAMYRFLRREQPAYDVYWVIDRDSPHRPHVDSGVVRGSVRNYLLYLVADGVFFSHSGSDVAPVLHRFVKHGPTRFFIEHGVVGLKRSKLSGFQPGQRLGPAADLYVSVSPWEKSIKVEHWRLPAEEVVITGLPRYDDLCQKAVEPVVAYMPTWREWLHGATEDEFRASDFRRFLEEVITSPEIAAVLERTGVTLEVHPHFYVHQHLSLLPEPAGAVRFAAPGADVQEALLSSRVLVTDYSSVAWDFGYLGKPVLFHQPDLARYLDERGSYLRMPDDLFGARSSNVGQLARNLEAALNDPSGAPTATGGWRKQHFAFHDQGNAARVFEAFQTRTQAPTRTRNGGHSRQPGNSPRRRSS